MATQQTFIEIAKEAFPRGISTAVDYAAVRQLLAKHTLVRFQQELLDAGVLAQTEDGVRITEDNNFFARLVGGKMPQYWDNFPGRKRLCDFAEEDRALIAYNTAFDDQIWNTDHPSAAICGGPADPMKHVYILPKHADADAYDWTLYLNALTFGMAGNKKQTLERVLELRKLAIVYAQGVGVQDPELCVHLYGWSSIAWLHVHMINPDPQTHGPNYSALRHKNLPLLAVIAVLWNELVDEGVDCTDIAAEVTAIVDEYLDQCKKVFARFLE